MENYILDIKDNWVVFNVEHLFKDLGFIVDQVVKKIKDAVYGYCKPLRRTL